MAKEDFCFTYYDGDAARDVAHMTRLCRGAYHDLVIMQRKVGPMTMGQIKMVLSSDFDTCWPSIEFILKTTDDQKYFIEWVEKSVKKHKHLNAGKETFVYVIRLVSLKEEFIKIGISNNLQKRYKDYEREGFNVDEIFTIKHTSRSDAESHEFDLHEKFIEFKYRPLLRFGGQTECFSIEVLKKISNV